MIEPKSKKLKKEDEDEKEDDIVTKKPEASAVKINETEDYADSLGCTICNEIMHDCIRLIHF